MNSHLAQLIRESTHSVSVKEIETFQSLWSGYGSIVRFGIEQGDVPSVIAKHVSLTGQGQHPRGWNTDLSHARKLKSYQVETNWYKHWSHHCNVDCYVPHCLALDENEEDLFMILEDLDASSFNVRKSSAALQDMKICLNWLAHFHATFMGQQPAGLWPTGTYWHLQTRPDELEELSDIPLKNAAPVIDKILADCPFQTFVHGDAKLANFCFSADNQQVAAVDFQYVGGGCGMKDVAYFIGSCLNEAECETMGTSLLDHYFSGLKQALISRQSTVSAEDVEASWRPLFAVAWTDFHRFIKGWSPGHWKINSYSERLASQVISNLASYQSAQ